MFIITTVLRGRLLHIRPVSEGKLLGNVMAELLLAGYPTCHCRISYLSLHQHHQSSEV